MLLNLIINPHYFPLFYFNVQIFAQYFSMCNATFENQLVRVIDSKNNEITIMFEYKTLLSTNKAVKKQIMTEKKR